jgi:hypothetical protein
MRCRTEGRGFFGEKKTIAALHLHAYAAEEFGVLVVVGFGTENGKDAIEGIGRAGALPPAFSQRLGHVDHLLTFRTPPVDHQVVFVGEADLGDPVGSLAALAVQG